VEGFLWENSEEVDEDGKKHMVRRPSAQLVAAVESIVPVVAPLMLKSGAAWAQKNFKPGPGGGSGGGGIGSLLGFIPKKYQGLAEMFLPQIQGLLGKFLGGVQGTGGAKGPPENPFM
jgi:hypothetical protein